MLKTIREEAKLTQRELAAKAGVHWRSIQVWEKLGIEHAKVDGAIKIARVLGCSIEDLLSGN